MSSMRMHLATFPATPSICEQCVLLSAQEFRFLFTMLMQTSLQSVHEVRSTPPRRRIHRWPAKCKRDHVHGTQCGLGAAESASLAFRISDGQKLTNVSRSSYSGSADVACIIAFSSFRKNTSSWVWEMFMQPYSMHTHVFTYRR